MKAIVSKMAICFSSAFLLLSSAHAMPPVQLNQSVLAYIPDKDIADFKAFIAQTLNDGKADIVQEWSSRSRTPSMAVKVQVTPSGPLQTQSAGQCRLLSAHVSRRTSTETWKVLFCQQATGGWKISGLE